MNLVYLSLSVITSVAGFGTFLCFLILSNYQASIWAFTTGLLGCILFRLHWLKYTNKIEEYYNAYSLWSIAWFGFSMFAIGISGFIYNCIIFAVLRPPILPVSHSTILSIVWCLLTLKTGAMLFWFGRKYAHFVLIDRTKLVENPSTSTDEPLASS